MKKATFKSINPGQQLIKSWSYNWQRLSLLRKEDKQRKVYVVPTKQKIITVIDKSKTKLFLDFGWGTPVVCKSNEVNVANLFHI